MPSLPQNWILISLGVLAAGVALSYLLEYFEKTLDQGRFGWQRNLRRRLGVEPGQRIAELSWFTLAVHLTMWPLLGLALLHLLGLHDLGRAFVDKLMVRGFSVAGTHIAPGKITLGLIAFLLLVTITRWFKRKLEQDWLPLTRLDPSVRMSVATVFGYATFLLALLVGLSAAGLDLSKIAIVAGALSVGIGFGLQNIFNNFVSGLILLFERPVRVGDYIKVGTTEGFVRRIRIRSTEIENSDRITIIVPNSQLLSSEVENWNYRDSLGRVIVAVGVAYDTDPELVRKVMLDAAKAHPRVIQEGDRLDVPGPFVAFKDFGDSSINFELRCYIDDIYIKLSVASDLRFALHKQFLALGIEVPFPQRDVFIKNAADVGQAKRQVDASGDTAEDAE
ncbi:MAG TPA: mechanosensitive ion channel domain-containing protein [Nevskiaceae bacterium]|nr:mechanosensitive ion channel domain-containing protein [Nevskiaceae bacterium]